jgi:hypothetical protein
MKLSKAIADDLDAIVKPRIIPSLSEHEFTLSMFANNYGISRDLAELILNDLIKANRVVYIGLRKASRAPCKAYALTAKIKK